MIPDRVIVRKIKEYDPRLFVQWNPERHYFEVWREMTHGRRLITPITYSIYEERGPIAYAPMDERILWWLYGADGWRTDRDWTREQDSRYQEFEARRIKAFNRKCRDFALDSYASTHNFYATRYASKNSRNPTFKPKAKRSNWSVPDSSARVSPRLFARTRANAAAYDYRGS